MVEGAGGRDRVSASAVHIPCCSQVLSRAHVFNCWDLKGCGAPCVPQTHSVASSAAILVHLPEPGRRVEYLVANEARATRVNWTATSGRNKAPSSPQGPCCIGNSRCHGMLACDGAGCSQLWRQEDGYEKQGGGGPVGQQRVPPLLGSNVRSIHRQHCAAMYSPKHAAVGASMRCVRRAQR